MRFSFRSPLCASISPFRVVKASICAYNSTFLSFSSYIKTSILQISVYFSIMTSSLLSCSFLKLQMISWYSWISVTFSYIYLFYSLLSSVKWLQLFSRIYSFCSCLPCSSFVCRVCSLWVISSFESLSMSPILSLLSYAECIPFSLWKFKVSSLAFKLRLCFRMAHSFSRMVCWSSSTCTWRADLSDCRFCLSFWSSCWNSLALSSCFV